jgi:transposase-like protein
LRKLVRRGLGGVELVISDAHEGIKAAVSRVLSTGWQHCRTHFVRNMRDHAARSGRRLIAAAIGTAFAEETSEAAHREWRRVSDRLRPNLPKLSQRMDEAEMDVLAYKRFPPQHWPKIGSTNPIERANAEIKRRTNVVGVFPNEAAILRLVGAVLMEQHNDWAAQDRHYMTLESLMPISDDPLASLGSPRALASPGTAGTAC